MTHFLYTSNCQVSSQALTVPSLMLKIDVFIRRIKTHIPSLFSWVLFEGAILSTILWFVSSDEV